MAIVNPLKPGDKVRILVSKNGYPLHGEIGVVESGPFKTRFDPDIYFYHIEVPGIKYPLAFIEDEIIKILLL